MTHHYAGLIPLLLSILGMFCGGTLSAQDIDNVSPSRRPFNSKDVTKISWRDVARKMPKEWYGSKEALNVADTVMYYQFPSGGWAKNHHWNQTRDRAELRHDMATTGVGSTIDNMATTLEMIFLAKVYNATGDVQYKDALVKAVNYLLEMQYDNGGWPQFYPLKVNKKGVPDYSAQITFNDGAMLNAMKTLRDIANEKAPYQNLGLSEDLKKKAAEAVERGR